MIASTKSSHSNWYGFFSGCGKAQTVSRRSWFWPLKIRTLPGVWPDVLTIAEPLAPCTTLDMLLLQPSIVRPSKNSLAPSS
jgi:hypothetical protein